MYCTTWKKKKKKKRVSDSIKEREREAHVIPVWVLDERQRVKGDLVHQLNTLVFSCMVNAPLQHAASVTMGGDFYAIGGHSVINKL
jgi:hypothetical protein